MCQSGKANSWQGDEVLHRWCKVYKGPEMVQRYLAGWLAGWLAGDNLMPSEIKYVESFIEEYYQNLPSTILLIRWGLGKMIRIHN